MQHINETRRSSVHRSSTHDFFITILSQRLLLVQLRIPQHTSESNQRHTETDTRDAKESLHMLIAIDDGVADRRADWISSDDCEWVSVCSLSKGVVGLEREICRQGIGKDLGPDRTGDCVAKGRADVVCCTDKC